MESENTTEKKSERTELSEVIRKELLRMCSEGDTKADGAFTVRALTRIVRYATVAEDMLVAESLVNGNTDALLRRRRGMNSGVIYGNGIIGGSAFVGEDDSMTDGGPMAKSSLNENFGMTAIREMVSSLKAMQESPMKLVEALAYSRKHGLKDAAAELERRLGIGQPEVAAIPAVGGEAVTNGGLT
jgi:hypothetical protein